MKQRFLIAAAVVVGAAGWAAGSSAIPAKVPHRSISVVAPCADPVVKLPETGSFRPGGPTFSVLADQDGGYEVTCEPDR